MIIFFTLSKQKKFIIVLCFTCKKILGYGWIQYFWVRFLCCFWSVCLSESRRRSSCVVVDDGRTRTPTTLQEKSSAVQYQYIILVQSCKYLLTYIERVSVSPQSSFFIGSKVVLIPYSSLT